jgi:hypothetical protein
MAMNDPTKYMSFQWSSSDRKLAKAVKTKIREMMAEAHTYHKSSVKWHDVQFVETGAVIPFKSASTLRTTYAWLFRAVVPSIKKLKFSNNDWVWEPVEGEASGLDKSIEGEASCLVSTAASSTEGKASGLNKTIAGEDSFLDDGETLFPPSVALKVSRGNRLVRIFGVLGLHRFCYHLGLCWLEVSAASCCANGRPDNHTDTNTDRHRHRHRHRHMHRHTPTDTDTNTHTHTDRHRHRHRLTHTDTDTDTYTDTGTDTDTATHTHTTRHTHTDTHSHTHSHIHTHTHTHSHTHTPTHTNRVLFTVCASHFLCIVLLLHVTGFAMMARLRAKCPRHW